ncbi:MAG: PQQ-binding-like beta-propeller repeat protein [Bacteroidota bacterium]
MKKLFTSIFLMGSLLSFGQDDEMKEIFVKEIGHSFHITGHNDEDDYTYASNDKEVSVLKNSNGEIKWNKRYKEITPEINKVDEIIPLWDADALFVFDRKLGTDKMACIDIHNGNLLWVSGKYQNVEEDNIVYIKELDAFAVTTKSALVMIKARTGEEMWQTQKFKGIVGYYVIKSDGMMTMINMKSSVLGSIFSGMKNQIMKINTKTGEVIWDQTYRGMAERKVLTREKLMSMDIKKDKIFLYLNGIQVFDYNSGAPIWAMAYDQTPEVVKKPANTTSFGAYGVVADAVVDGDHVYVLDMINKRKQYVKKYELNTGALVWTSPEIKDARAIPNMFVHNGKVVLQVGGAVEVQYIQRTRESDGSVTITRAVETQNVKPFNVQAFDANTGTQVWESEKMKKGITNAFIHGDNVIICSGKALYSMEVATGTEKYEMPLGKDKIGLADRIVGYHDNVAIIGEKGVSMRKMKDGDLIGSAKYKRATPLSYNGKVIYKDALALITPKSDVGVFNLDKMTLKKFDARKGATSYLSEDGTNLFVLESGGMLRKSKFTKLGTK